MAKRTIVLGVLALAAGGALWLVLEREPEPAQGPAAPATSSSGPGTGGETRPAAAALRDPVVPAQPVDSAPLVEDAATAEERSALERRLAAVADSFLGEDPQVAELLEVLGALAAAAVVDLESVERQHDPEGLTSVVRGRLDAGGLAATFHVEEGTFRILFPASTGRAPLSRRDLQISFGANAGGATGCRAVVQYQPDPAESPRTHLRPDEERLVGWMLSITPEAGCELRPMSVAGSGDEWLIGSRREGEVRELPWISNTASFDAWLRVLEPLGE